MILHGNLCKDRNILNNDSAGELEFIVFEIRLFGGHIEDE